MNTAAIVAVAVVVGAVLLLAYHLGYFSCAYNCLIVDVWPTLTFTPNPTPQGGMVTATLTGFQPNSTVVIMTGCHPCDIMVVNGIAINADGNGSAQLPTGIYGLMRASGGDEYADATLTVGPVP